MGKQRGHVGTRTNQDSRIDYIAENLSPPPAGGYQSTYYRPISGYLLTLVEASMFRLTGLFSGSKWRQQTRKPSHFGSHSASEPLIFRGL